MSNWDILSWLDKPNKQAINYIDRHQLDKCLTKLRKNSSLVSHHHIEKLTNILANASQGNSFIIQGGDCAERINAPLSHSKNTIDLLSELRNYLSINLNKPVVAVGRIAGQYAKPRTNLFDINNQNIPNYRGDMINKPQPDIISRIPDPNGMLKAYNRARQTMELISSIQGNKELDDNSLIYTSHEAVNLYYESSLTRKIDGKFYNISTHFPWAGIRSNNLEGAHLEYLRGIENPIALKIDSKTTPDNLEKTIEILNPTNKLGRLTLITRFGKDNVRDNLSRLIQKQQKMHYNITWICDPMHGNLKENTEGQKVRHIDDIIEEIQETITIHNKYNSYLSGIHLECTKENVIECQDKSTVKLNKPLVDPRLNYQQSKNVITKLYQALILEHLDETG